jgi:hypothetical protein
MFCKDCAFWRDGYCDKVNYNIVTGEEKSSFEIEFFTDDDSSLTIQLKTGPEFGCVKFEKKMLS